MPHSRENRCWTLYTAEPVCGSLPGGIDVSLLEHVSPIEWDNVMLYGQYILDRKLVQRRRRGGLTPVR